MSVGGLYGALPSLIERYRQKANDPSPPLRPNQKPPLTKVYQYTRLQTLLDSTQPWQWTDQQGTVQDMSGQRVIWATAAPYMNDRNEYAHGCEKLRQALDRRKQANVPTETSLLARLETLLNEKLGKRFYVACFSQKSDDLGQWRGYGEWEKGVCLGYNYVELVQASPWFSGWVIYEPLTQEKVAESLVNEIIDRVVPSIVLDPSIEVQILDAACELLSVILPPSLLLMKDHAFRDEAEFRLIHAEDAPEPPEVRYRIKGNRVIPYIEMSFEDATTLSPVSSPLEEIILGPASNDQLNIDAVEGLVAKRGIQNVPVTPSPIPFLA
jgi:hypothetical protein